MHYQQQLTNHRDHGGDGQGEGLRHPVYGHQEDQVGALHGLHRHLVLTAEQDNWRQEEGGQDHHPGPPEHFDELFYWPF